MKRLSVTFPDSLYYRVAAAAATNKRSLSAEVVGQLDPASDYHNPLGLTDEQIGTAEGWRLCLKTEKGLTSQLYIADEGGHWIDSALRETAYGETRTTYRTKAPLP